MGDLLHDVRLGVRALARSPGLTAAAVVVLALGVGANSAIFSLVDAVLFRPPPVRDPPPWLSRSRLTNHTAREYLGRPRGVEHQPSGRWAAHRK